MPSIDYYKRKCDRLTKERDAAVAALRQVNDRIAFAMVQIDAIEAAAANRATLISIERNNRKIKFTFHRNNHLTTIETYGTWDDDVESWNKELLI